MNKRHIEDDDDESRYGEVTLDTDGDPKALKGDVVGENLEWWKAFGTHVNELVKAAEMRAYTTRVAAECNECRYAHEDSKQRRKRSKLASEWECETRDCIHLQGLSSPCLVSDCYYKDRDRPYRRMYRLKGTRWAYLCDMCHDKYCASGGDMPHELRTYINKKFRVPDNESDDEDEDDDVVLVVESKK